MSCRAHLALPCLLIGCGILRNEIEFLRRKNGWNLSLDFLEPSLHVNLTALHTRLSAQLHQHRHRRPVVFYGCCHPQMDDLLERAGTCRTEGQNCIEMLLGPERYMSELEAGAFFLLEEWSRNWHDVMTLTFGPHGDVARAIFHEDRKYMLAVRTPVSPDFTAAAEAAARSVELPLRWSDAGLEHLEQVLIRALQRQQQEQQQQ
jgi:hypothetical protein